MYHVLCTMSLYLKYRPKTIDELDLAGVRKTLSDIVAANSVGHAYLLTGPRGAGKTSTARILARIVNCEKNEDKLGEPCNKCRNCQSVLNGSSLDFIEIDAASNRGIDDIRELKERVRLSPSELKYKVYIIDEVHMLTIEAFNALLKTLEEPPPHAIFILCTTETHKVPATILSRCVHIQFGKATPEEMKRSLARVVEGEGKAISEEALDYLAKAVDGSFRDGVKILDVALANSSEVKLDDIEEQIVGAAGYKPAKLIEALMAKKGSEALSFLGEASLKGVDLSYLVVSVMKGLRDELLAGADTTLTKLIFALDDVARKMGTSPVPVLLIEVVIIDWCGSPTGGNIQTPNPKPQTPNNNAKNNLKNVKTAADESKSAESSGENQKNMWSQLLANLNGDNITMGALLSKATPAEIKGDLLKIYVGYGFHRDQIMSERVLAKLEKMVSEVVGRPIKVKCEVNTSIQPAAISGQREVNSQDDIIDEAVAIFNSGN